MELVFYLTLLLVASFSKGHEGAMLREEEGERENDANSEDTIAYESFGSPVYGPKSGGLNGKSAYNIPAPAVPASYAAYLGLGNPYAYGPYNRINMLPYTYPSVYGYGAASLLSNPGYSSALTSGLGYAGYGSPYLGRSTYPGLGYGYPGYLSNLGYRYLPDALRRGPAPVVGIPPPVPRAAAPVPAPVAAVPAPVPVPEPVVFPYRPALRAIRGKDGVVRYTLTPDAQNFPIYK